MIDDLAFAKSAVDWADANLPSFKDRMEAWVKDNIYPFRRELEDNTHDMLLVGEREQLPLVASVEFGAYLNALRSALDILCCAVAARHGVTKLDGVYFPVARDAAAFASGDYKGHKFIERLPGSERQRFESFKPYKGGDPNIWLLHHLDVERKHRRILSVEPKIASFGIMGWGLNIIPINGEVGANGETALCFIAKGANYAQLQFTAVVAIDEPSLSVRQQAWFTLQRFSKRVREIISEFDLT